MGQNIEQSYLILLNDILQRGTEKSDRTGTGTISVFGRQIRHDMSKGFPLLTTKKMYWKGIVTELIWFLRGDTNIKWLVENGNNIWVGDAYKNYCKIAGSVEEPDYDIHVDDPNQNCTRLMTQEEFIERIKTGDKFANEWGELGPVYGKQWRNWGGRNITKYDLKDVKGSDQPKVVEAVKNGEDVTKYGVKVEYQNNSIDQIANLINDLKNNPDSRRLMVSAWNPSDLDSMVLPPCHYGFQVYTRELSLKERVDYGAKRNMWRLGQTINYLHCDEMNIPTRAISLMWNQRSVDTPLGLPFNIASYALLLEIIARSVNMVPDELIGNLGDCHIYKNQVDGVEEQLTRETYKLPKLEINSGNENWHLLDIDDIINSLDCDLTFKIKDYESHPTIKTPLSN